MVIIVSVRQRFFQTLQFSSSSSMVSDIQLAMFSNLIGIILFLLVVLYHFISANY